MTRASSPLGTIVSAVRSAWIWTAITVLILVWLPLLAVIRIFDLDPVRYRTGRWFRRLGVAMVRINPAWRVHLSGERVENPRNPYVVVGNHLSNADIPIVSHLPWEMKWVGKEELFKIPIVGWMMQLSGDIPVDRDDRRSAVQALRRALWYLERNCSVMFFAEGTRSPDGRLLPFKDGAFVAAVKAQVPILPVMVDGSQNALPKHTWLFNRGNDVYVHVFPPVDTAGLSGRDVPALRDRVRALILEALAERRGLPPAEIDAAVDLLPDGEG